MLFVNECYFRDSLNHKFCIYIRRGDFVGHPFLLPSKMTFIEPAVKLVAKELFEKYGKVDLVVMGNDGGFVKNLKLDKKVR